MITFDENFYLELNPDVKQAVAIGTFESGEQHYKLYGHKENRKPYNIHSREDKILSYIDKNLKGLEIGPSHRPIAQKKNKFNVKIIDHLDKDGLIEKYKSHGVDINAIEEVDYVWNGEPMSELIHEKFDWIIASHVIEHTPDFIGFINECSKMLNKNSVLSLAIPDKRYCFDHHRELTSLSRMIDARGNKIHSAGTVAEYYLKVVKKDGSIAWNDDSIGVYQNVHTLKNALEGIEKVKKGEYIDVHAWVFTPESFISLIKDLNSLGFIQLQVLDFFETVGHEFFVILKK